MKISCKAEYLHAYIFYIPAAST